MERVGVSTDALAKMGKDEDVPAQMSEKNKRCFVCINWRYS